MAKAKKLPSGQWRTLVYDYIDSTGKRHYESFTAESKKESEYMAAEFAMNKSLRKKPNNMTLSDAIDEYIKNSDSVLSPTTLQGYCAIKNHSYNDLMDIPLKKLTNEMLQNAVNIEAKRPSLKNSKNKKNISPKTVKNSYGLLTAVINRYYSSLDCTVKLPSLINKMKDLPSPDVIMSVVKNTEIELPVLLAMWLSFSLSEIKGLKRSSIKDGYITINEVVVMVNREAIRKEQAKTFTRTRRHQMPEYIQLLVDKAIADNEDIEELIVLSGHAIYSRFKRLLAKNNIPHMSFHDLRHVNASVMAMLRIPDKYAMERGGWKSDNVMKKVYTHTFSEEREKVDLIIDDYFEKTLRIKDYDTEAKKYKAWLMLYDKVANVETLNEFKKFLQHEMQHK